MPSLMPYPILITGASRGLGAAIAKTLSPEHDIIAVARTIGGLEALDDRIRSQGGDATTLVPMDITNAQAMGQLCNSVRDRWGGLRAWVHTAIHAAPLSPVDHISPKDWEKSLAINVTATAALIAMLAPLLVKSEQGQAVFFNDQGARGKFFGSYGATKAAQIALAHSWQAETERIGPLVQILSPNPMATATRARFYPGEDRSKLMSVHDEAARLCKITRLLGGGTKQGKI